MLIYIFGGVTPRLASLARSECVASTPGSEAAATGKIFKRRLYIQSLSLVPRPAQRRRTTPVGAEATAEDGRMARDVAMVKNI